MLAMLGSVPAAHSNDSWSCWLRPCLLPGYSGMAVAGDQLAAGCGSYGHWHPSDPQQHLSPSTITRVKVICRRDRVKEICMQAFFLELSYGFRYAELQTFTKQLFKEQRIL